MNLLTTATEAEFQRLVVEAAQLHGWHVAHFRPARTQSGGWATPMQGDKGFPDLVMARGGRVIFAELKSEKGRLTDEQRSWMGALTGRPEYSWNTWQVTEPRANPEAYVWRPSDFEEIREVLR